mmetsp:Transcript_10514/g.21744  ORF Transcript_10514/g.21744 Transcript_10514/m.21744 type:complete len:215 (+) Transcript_10514:828-1472(+)
MHLPQVRADTFVQQLLLRGRREDLDVGHAQHQLQSWRQPHHHGLGAVVVVGRVRAGRSRSDERGDAPVRVRAAQDGQDQVVWPALVASLVRLGPRLGPRRHPAPVRPGRSLLRRVCTGGGGAGRDVGEAVALAADRHDGAAEGCRHHWFGRGPEDRRPARRGARAERRDPDCLADAAHPRRRVCAPPRREALVACELHHHRGRLCSVRGRVRRL